MLKVPKICLKVIDTPLIYMTEQYPLLLSITQKIISYFSVGKLQVFDDMFLTKEKKKIEYKTKRHVSL